MMPQGMSLDAFNYLIAFTKAHEGYTPFFYNNWPLKNSDKDVTVGVGIAVKDRQTAANDPIRNMFRMKATGAIPSTDQIKAEFDRVNDLPRTKDNLFTDYGGQSPMEIPANIMHSSLLAKMNDCWNQRGVPFPDFAKIQAQAQVALLSFNYGMRLSNRLALCDAVKAEDFYTAATLCVVSKWDSQKNEAHQRLLYNSGVILMANRDLNLLPPITGPFKPPPCAPNQFKLPPLFTLSLKP
jgi:hypothetical protein